MLTVYQSAPTCSLRSSGLGQMFSSTSRLGLNRLGVTDPPLVIYSCYVPTVSIHSIREEHLFMWIKNTHFPPPCRKYLLYVIKETQVKRKEWGTFLGWSSNRLASGEKQHCPKWSPRSSWFLWPDVSHVFLSFGLYLFPADLLWLLSWSQCSSFYTVSHCTVFTDFILCENKIC